MKKLLFISASNFDNLNSGGGKGSLRNYKLIKKFFDIDLIYLSRDFSKIDNKIVLSSTKNKIHTAISELCLRSSYLSLSSEKKILEIVKKRNYIFIFLDSSNYGRLAKKIKKINSEIKIFSFFHNIECDYVKAIIKTEKAVLKYLNYIKLRSSVYNEKLAIKYSDYLITLNSRDTRRLYEMYGGKSDLELPITFEDRYFKDINIKNSLNEKEYILFVGSLFFANYHGIKWFIENVVPFINKKLLIVGKDFETKKLELERENVEVIGSVDDLTPYYLNASCMIMPIFEGAGMKVKTAEALMYGKTIYGTTEAFEGYEIEHDKVGGLCNTKEEFIKKINSDQNIKFNEYSRKIFLEKYSFESSEEIFKKFLENNKIIYKKEEIK